VPVPGPPFSKKEYARRGTETYEREIRPKVEAEHEGKFVALDIESGMWEIDADDFTATERLLQHSPQSQIWLVRVGQRATYRIGGPRRPEKT
jgi:hypothetical protein